MRSKDVSILIVDDEKPMLDLLNIYLGSSYECETAASAEEAVELLAARFFNLVLVDVILPGVSGLELCRLIHTNWPDTVVIVMSAMPRVRNEGSARQQGVVDYLEKPFSLERLKSAIECALRHQALVSEMRYVQSRVW